MLKENPSAALVLFFGRIAFVVNVRSPSLGLASHSQPVSTQFLQLLNVVAFEKIASDQLPAECHPMSPCGVLGKELKRFDRHMGLETISGADLVGDEG